MHTEELINKYKQGDITYSELAELRQLLKNISDEQIGDILQESVDHMYIPDQKAEMALDEIKQSLYSVLEMNGKETVRVRLDRFIRIGAAVVVALLLISTVYFYHKAAPLSFDTTEMVIYTAQGERVVVVLPDETKVSLNSESRLAYTPSDFNKRSRKITFEGEAFFEVVKNPKVPFIVVSQGVRLTVLGTKFKYLSRRDHDYIIVSMAEGVVDLSKDCSDSKGVKLYANQIGRYNKQTGEIAVSHSRTDITIPWINKKMVFESAPLKDVIKEIERSYGIDIVVDGDSICEETFTGMLPINNLEEVIETVEKCFDMGHYRVDTILYFNIRN